MHMKQLITCLLFGTLAGMTPHFVSAQHNQSPQYSVQELKSLKKRVSELEKQLQVVENVEKMELQAKLADANAKLLNAEFGKFERDLRDANDSWLIKWGIFALTFLAVVGAGALAWVKSRTNQLIADRVEKNLDGFKEGLEEVGTLKNEIGVLKDQQRVLEREHTTATLEDFLFDSLWYEQNHPEQIKGLREEALLDVFGDTGRIQEIRHKAAEVLIARQSPQSVSPALELLNLVLDSDDDIDFETLNTMRPFVNLLARIHTPETYEGLKDFLNRLLKERPTHGRLFFEETVLAFGWVGIELNMKDSASILKSAIPHLQHPGYKFLSTLVWYFDRLNEPESIKYLLTKHVTDGMPEVKEQCLTVLEKYDPEFVEKWRAENTTDDTESA